MNVIILVKQVPDTDDIKLKAGEEFDLRKMNLPRRVNTFDKYVIEEAARLKDADPDVHVTVLTMGDESAERAVVEAMSVSGDSGYLICDSRLKGSDSLASAKILRAAVRYIEELEGKTDLIIAGRQSGDGATSQTPVMLAELLNFSLITSAVEIKESFGQETAEGYDAYADSGDGHVKSDSVAIRKLKVIKRLADGCEDKETELPAVITMTKPDHEVRFPTFKRIRWANSEKIKRLSAEDLIPFGLDTGDVGAAGSHTAVLSVKKPGRNSRNAIIKAADFSDAKDDREKCILAADKLLSMLEEDKILKK